VKLTVTVITRNEEANIEGALESVQWADEIVVVDSHSVDETVRLAERHAARIVTHEWSGYSAQRNYAAEIASNDWILALDADERVPPALAGEIKRIMREGSVLGGYRMPRVSYYLGRWIRGTDWYPDYQLRLYDRRVGRFNGKRVHESVELKYGQPGTLEHDLQHFPYRDISDHVTSIDHYTTLAAEEWFAEGRRTNPVEAAVHPPAAFLRNYVFRRGFRDGTAGFLISILNSYYVFLKILKLWELQRGFRTPGAGEGPGASSARRRPKFAKTPNVEGRRQAETGPDSRSPVPDPLASGAPNAAATPTTSALHHPQ
jgi:glycosyltransferase involved in cell wall biosynthesis